MFAFYLLFNYNLLYYMSAKLFVCIFWLGGKVIQFLSVFVKNTPQVPNLCDGSLVNMPLINLISSHISSLHWYCYCTQSNLYACFWYWGSKVCIFCVLQVSSCITSLNNPQRFPIGSTLYTFENIARFFPDIICKILEVLETCFFSKFVTVTTCV